MPLGRLPGWHSSGAAGKSHAVLPGPVRAHSYLGAPAIPVAGTPRYECLPGRSVALPPCNRPTSDLSPHRTPGIAPLAAPNARLRAFRCGRCSETREVGRFSGACRTSRVSYQGILFEHFREATGNRPTSHPSLRRVPDFGPLVAATVRHRAPCCTGRLAASQAAKRTKTCVRW